MMTELPGKAVRPIVVWEPVLFTDWSSPSTATLGRISNPRTAQFWDRTRLISRSMGEHDHKSIVWDHISIYPRGAAWTDGPPRPVYEGGPVVRVLDEARTALTQALKDAQVKAAGAN